MPCSGWKANRWILHCIVCRRVGGSGPRVQVPGRAALGVSSQPNLHQQQQQPNSTSALRTSQGRQGSQSTTGKAPGSSIRAQPPSW
jgi:hypothetical protein